MSVDIQKHPEQMIAISGLRNPLLQVSSHQLYFGQAHLEAFWVIICEEMAVHVSALRVAAVVARYDTVWVDNWHDPEFKLVSKLIGERILGY